MCGILAIASAGADPLALHDDAIIAMRDRLAHRGPDSAGLTCSGSVALAQTRLAVIDPTPEADQPMTTADGRFTLVYNGELYNDRELRRELEREGASFRTECDTETVLQSLAVWGESALDRFRGMYALALHDGRENALLLARDPLGIKPLYLWQGSLGGRPSLIVASEIPAILAHPDVSAKPDPVGVVAYLTTLRTSILRRTMFEGVETLLAGERVRIELRGQMPRLARSVAGLYVETVRDLAPREVARAVEDSVARHLRADVPMCCLLSGGLDSSIIASIAREHTSGPLYTYCAGARDEHESPDFEPARIMASALGTLHTEVGIDRDLFLDRWRELVAQSGSPLSTPNEIAIHEVARAMRANGHVVTLSGEGADELFGGYTQPLTLAQQFIDGGEGDGGAFQLDAFAWMTRDARAVVLQGQWLEEFEMSDASGDPILEAYRAIWDRAAAPQRMDEPLLPHARFHRHVNLGGLLRRLDTMTMLASVEGRTPLADTEIALMSDALPVARRYRAGSLGKLALREAFAGRLPGRIVSRPKASFPLPFESWLEGARGWLREARVAREIFQPAALRAIDDAPGEQWQLAWPMINLALWADRWF